MSLDEYGRKRDFTVTAEPPARAGTSSTGRSFVVQKHRARQLHYDFRLELGGVLKSWSVPKGPCLDPAAKRLAVAVEDHPVDYGDFEGIIPRGQYGGGTVLLWDRGVWEPLSDPIAALAKGHLKFRLHGEKLRGRWALVRLGSRARGRDSADQRSWLLVKDRDEHARPESEWSVTEARSESVATGRDMDAIAASSDRVWHSRRGPVDAGAVPGARSAPIPDWIQPAQPRRSREVPDGARWLHEIQIAGERVLVRIDGGKVHILGLDRRDRSRDLPAIVAAARALPVRQAIVDGVATTLGEDGRAGDGRPADTLYAVDLPFLDGHDLGQVPLDRRKGLLAALLARSNPAQGAASGGLRYADHVLGRGPEVFARATSLGAAGVVSKVKDSPYPPPASAWRLVRCPVDLARSAGSSRLSAEAPAAASGARKVTATRVAGVGLTHPGRVLYPDAGVTKLDLALFYQRVAERMLPHLVDRPLTLVRAPNGVGEHRFFVRHAVSSAPRQLGRVEITGGTGSGMAMVVSDVSGLVALAQMNVLEVHPWNARTSTIDEPDRMIFDLDPGPEVPWSDVVEGAKWVRDVLASLNLASFVKTTGGKGLHVVVPLAGGATWADTLDFSRAIARALERFAPARFSAGLAKAGREDKIFVDYLRNRRGATAASVYSSRAHAAATVSVAVTWDELGFATRNDAFHVLDADAWNARRDPWVDYGKTRQRLDPSRLRAAHAVLERAPRAMSALHG